MLYQRSQIDYNRSGSAHCKMLIIFNQDGGHLGEANCQLTYFPNRESRLENRKLLSSSLHLLNISISERYWGILHRKLILILTNTFSGGISVINMISSLLTKHMLRVSYIQTTCHIQNKGCTGASRFPFRPGNVGGGWGLISDYELLEVVFP